MKSTTVETCTSDFHKITTNVLRKTISKGNAKNIFYRDYKAFNENTFEMRPQSKLTFETIANKIHTFSLYFWKP